MSKTVLHKADSRGKADHGWLKSYHSFSFSGYYNPERMNFGALRVLNDDYVAGGKGFGEHPHDNMEIISIPLSGGLKHQDSLNNIAVISDEDIQVMSAGSGIYHQENNNDSKVPVQFLQIWIYPNVLNVTPRYDQIHLVKSDRHNRLQQILSPFPDDEGVWIYQNAWFHIGNFDLGFENKYVVKSLHNGVYIFVLSGKIQIDNQVLDSRDGFGVWETEVFNILALEDSEFLLMEVPMEYEIK